MENELREILNKIQYSTGLTQEKIAQRIGYSRPHLTTAVRNNTKGKILDTLKREFADVLATPKDKEAHLESKVTGLHAVAVGLYAKVHNVSAEEAVIHVERIMRLAAEQQLSGA